MVYGDTVWVVVNSQTDILSIVGAAAWLFGWVLAEQMEHHRIVTIE